MRVVRVTRTITFTVENPFTHEYYADLTEAEVIAGERNLPTTDVLELLEGINSVDVINTVAEIVETDEN